MRPPELAFIDRMNQRFAYTANWAGLARIVGWTSAFLVVLNIWFVQQPYLQMHAGLDGDPLNPMMANTEETHWVRTEPRHFPAGERDNIAWVAGSGIRIPLEDGDQTFLPELTLANLSAEHGIDAEGWIYYIQAGRPLDMYTAALNAIERQPDALYLEINPVWALTNLQLYGFDNLRNGGAHTWHFPNDIALQLLIASPGNHLWSNLGRHIPRVPLDLSQRTSRWFNSRIGRTSSALLAESAGTSDKLEGVALTQGSQFWLTPSLTDGELDAYRIRDAADADNRKAAIQGAIMARSTPAAATWPAWLLEQQLQAVSASGIPTVVYVAPLVATNISDPRLLDAYQALLTKLRTMKTDFDAPGRLMIVDYPAEIMAGITQRDYVHILEPGGLAAYLALEMSELETSDE